MQQTAPTSASGATEAPAPTLATIRQTLADLAARHFGVDAQACLAGRPWLELDPGFDSLALTELYMMLEEALGIELDPPDPPWPADIDAMAQSILDQWQRRQGADPRVG